MGKPQFEPGDLFPKYDRLAGVTAEDVGPEIAAALTPEKIAEAFSLDRQLRNIDRIFERVFGEQ